MLINKISNRYIKKMLLLREEKATCLSEVVAIYKRAERAGEKMEERISDELVRLSPKKHARLILQVIDELTHSGLYVHPMPRHLETDYSPPEKSEIQIEALKMAKAKLESIGEKMLIINPLYREILKEKHNEQREKYIELQNLEGRFWPFYNRVPTQEADEALLADEALSIDESKKLISLVLSDAFSVTHYQVLTCLEQLVGEEKTFDFILNRDERRSARIQWNEEKRLNAGLPSDDKPLTEKILFALYNTEEDEELPEVQQEDTDTLKPSRLKWLKGVNALAELLHRLERGGYIDLGRYFAERNTGINLARNLCQLFELPGANTVGNLNNYITTLKTALGPGRPDGKVLTRIGRKRIEDLDHLFSDMESSDL